jgi:tetratricopeptide (TPR) repeat protein
MKKAFRSIGSCLAATVLSFAVSGLGTFSASLAQDITGGSSAELASAAEVESRSGRGVFTAPKTVSHHVKRPEKKTVARTTKVSKPQRETASTSRPDRTRTDGSRTTGGGSTSGTGDRGIESSKPLGDAARRVAGPEELTKQGEDLFDAGQYEKAIDLYKRALRQKPDFPEAHLNLSEAYFNLGRYDEAIASANQAIQQRSDWAHAHVALGNAYIKLDRDADAIAPLRKALELEPQNSAARDSLSLIYYDQGVAAYNANKFDEAIAAYKQAITVKTE